MNMRVPALLLAALAVPVWAADDDGARITAAFCADASTAADYDRCSADELAHAQADLATTFDAVRAKWHHSPETLAALQRAQTAWTATLDADVSARFADVDAERERGGWVGTAYASAHNLYEARLTRERTGQLCEFLRGAAYGERRREPCAELAAQAHKTQKK